MNIRKSEATVYKLKYVLKKVVYIKRLERRETGSQVCAAV